MDFKNLISKHFGGFKDTDNLPIHQMRKAAFNIFEKKNFPSKKNEDWKYTDTTDILSADYQLDSHYKLSNQELNKYRFGYANFLLLVFLNGKFVKDFSNISPEFSILTPEKGVNITNLGEACNKHKSIINTHLGKYANNEQNAFVAMNTAFAQEGAFIRIANNKTFGKPILILNFVSNKTLSQLRNLVIAEEGSKATLIEHFIALDQEVAFTNTVTEIAIGENAQVDHYKLQTDYNNSHHIGTIEVHQKEKSIFNSMVVSTSGKLIRNNLNISLDGEHCQTYMNGFYMLDEKSHIDNHTSVDHIKPNTYSNELYKGVLDQQATGVFNGKIFVRQNAQKTNAFQFNKNILISKNASMDTKPQLEIWANDVKCSHGCTVGNLDETPMFYLRSRGIPEKQARNLLVRSFTVDVIEKIKLAPIRKYIEEKIDEKMK